jgi:hypothetical protein
VDAVDEMGRRMMYQVTVAATPQDMRTANTPQARTSWVGSRVEG